MATRIPPSTRSSLLKNPRVKEVTEFHVITTDGAVFEAKDFVLADLPLRFVIKLVRCRCCFAKHPAGKLAVVSGRVRCYVDGRRQEEFDAPALCRRGEWVREERLQSATAVKVIKTKASDDTDKKVRA